MLGLVSEKKPTEHQRSPNAGHPPAYLSGTINGWWVMIDQVQDSASVLLVDLLELMPPLLPRCSNFNVQVLFATGHRRLLIHCAEWSVVPLDHWSKIPHSAQVHLVKYALFEIHPTLFYLSQGGQKVKVLCLERHVPIGHGHAEFWMLIAWRILCS